MNEFPRFPGMPEEIPLAQNYANLAALTQAILLGAIPEPIALYARAAQTLIMAESAYGYMVRNFQVSQEDEQRVECYLADILAHYDATLGGLPNYGGQMGQLIKGVIDQMSDVRALLRVVLDGERSAEDPEYYD